MGIIGALSPKNIKKRSWTVLFPELATRGLGADALSQGIAATLAALYGATGVFETREANSALAGQSPALVLQAAFQRMGSGRMQPVDIGASALLTIALFGGLFVGVAAFVGGLVGVCAGLLSTVHI